MKKTILIHHHIFKNAGTSLNYSLKNFFGENFFEYDLPNSNLVTKEILEEFILAHPKALAISSHHACLPTPQSQDYQTVSSILLRRPLDRIESIYKFEQKQNAQTEGAIKAKEFDFKNYVIWRLKYTPTMFCNYQTHYCSRIHQEQIKEIPTETNLEIAMENLKKCLIVGTVERYDETLKLGEERLKKFYPKINLKYVRLNTTSEAPEKKSDLEVKNRLIDKLSKDVVLELEEKNQLDEKLYDFVDKMLTARLRFFNLDN
jgi:hypothetical protein